MSNPANPLHDLKQHGEDAAANGNYDQAHGYYQRARDLLSGPRPPELQALLLAPINAGDAFVDTWQVAHMVRAAQPAEARNLLSFLLQSLDDTTVVLTGILPTLQGYLRQEAGHEGPRELPKASREGLNAALGSTWSRIARTHALGAVACGIARDHGAERTAQIHAAEVAFSRAYDALVLSQDWPAKLENALHARRFAQLYGNPLARAIWPAVAFWTYHMGKLTAPNQTEELQRVHDSLPPLHGDFIDDQLRSYAERP